MDSSLLQSGQNLSRQLCFNTTRSPPLFIRHWTIAPYRICSSNYSRIVLVENICFLSDLMQLEWTESLTVSPSPELHWGSARALLRSEGCCGMGCAVSPKACLPSSEMNLCPMLQECWRWRGFWGNVFIEPRRHRAGQGCLSHLLHPHRAFMRYVMVWGFRVTINWLNPNSQFGVLAAVWWFLAGQDLESF